MSYSLEGIHFMLPTPFKNDGTVDYKSFEKLVEIAKTSGCLGVVSLGVMGESSRLADAERLEVMQHVIQMSKSKNLTVIVGISSESIHLVCERGSQAEQLGADAVMVAPSRLAKPNDIFLSDYYTAVHDACSIPIIIQDYPAESGIFMTPEIIAKLNKDLPRAYYLKLEDSPTPPKISRIKKLTGESLGIFGGLGGSFLFEELMRGAIGTMTGFAYPEVLVAIKKHISNGDIKSARKIFYDWVPYIRYENQPGIGLAIRKYAMFKRGLISEYGVRSPTPSLDKDTIVELDDILANLPDLNNFRIE
ncbi:MAG TPA: dihydrodipicolinate synthase family protein [Dehalococcoidia bacterium]|nr:dihydrodipicolinate synthase family protein [Dehalococcoidia bacterium]|tara:strand:+ start:65 stop:979 length:915 start_codon:yes stop_codon:yes gene_type:complete